MFFIVFSNDQPPTEIYTLSLHDALPICLRIRQRMAGRHDHHQRIAAIDALFQIGLEQRIYRRDTRSEEHTSELQSHSDLVCRLLLEKKKPKSRRGRRTATRYKRKCTPTG